jgi:hypothetical protein
MAVTMEKEIASGFGCMTKFFKRAKSSAKASASFSLSPNGERVGVRGGKVRTRLLTRIYFFSKSAGNSAARRILSCTPGFLCRRAAKGLFFVRVLNSHAHKPAGAREIAVFAPAPA